ncbi:cell wall hydrolase [Novosphingobium sp.]|uniref:cell wall hydrolase n=1 Tax=Novosphingobium sp. TaxID=1874826 RepID=UPI0035B45F87
MLALLPLILLIWASFRIAPSSAAELSLERNPLLLSELARLPGSPDATPSAQLALPAGSLDPRALNAAIPFIAGKIDPAPPYRFAGGPTDRTNARDCLALAAMAEAGPSDPGQRAVMQVVLNRARHPAFANSVCGVVFEGAERATGCQFTFTCDGSLSRQYTPASWEAARQRADQALSGYVYRPVGNATHYHTDWVFPWWSPKLQKLAQVETHLFLRWPGYWGSVASWRKGRSATEPSFADLLSRFARGTPAEAELAAQSPLGEVVMPPLPADTPKVSGGAVVMRLPSGKANFVLVTPAAGADSVLTMARKLCPEAGTCRVMGWADRGLIPAALPLPAPSRSALQFSYARDPAGTEIALYNCETYPGLPREKCIPRAR